nr:putative transposase (putative), gypsy type [Tanacetum cinerariifolium]
MVRDNVQLETAVNTITYEYLLEFTSEYGISEALRPEFPGPGDRIVDFLEGKVGVYTRFFEFANFRLPLSQFLYDVLGYYQIHISQLSVIGAAKVSHFEINCRVQNIVPTLSLFRVFYVPSFNSGWMSFSKRPGKNTPQCYTKPLDSLKNWNDRFFWVDECVFPTAVEWRTSASKDGMPASGTYSVDAVRVLDTHRTPIQKQPEALLCLVDVVAGPPTVRESRKRGPEGVDANARPKSLRRDHTDRPSDPGSENASSPIEVLSPGSVYRPEWGVTNGSLLDTPEACQDLVDHVAPPAKLLKKSIAQVARREKRIQDRELEIKNLEVRLETEAEMKKAAEGKNAELVRELEDICAQFSGLQVSNEHLSQQVAALREQVSGVEKLKAAFEEFKRYEDDRVEKRCAELDAHLDALSIDFDEELYPHMLTTIAGRRWVIEHGLRLAMMKCAESLEMRQAFADVVSA